MQTFLSYTVYQIKQANNLSNCLTYLCWNCQSTFVVDYQLVSMNIAPQYVHVDQNFQSGMVWTVVSPQCY